MSNDAFYVTYILSRATSTEDGAHSDNNSEATQLSMVVRAKLADAATPGFEAEFDPHEAEHAGAFVEDALSYEDAVSSTPDLLNTQRNDPLYFMR